MDPLLLTGADASEEQVDVILVGGGLANGLIAWQLSALRPDLSLAIVEQEATFGGSRTWSCFETDLSTATCSWLQPFIGNRWPAYEVRFPTYRRTLSTGYITLHAERFHAVLHERALSKGWTILHDHVERIATSCVETRGGRRLYGRCVIDGRGFESTPELTVAYQKFLGQVLEMQDPHAVENPIIMDACVEQKDGYHFVYVLPLSPTTLLVEDTWYSNDMQLDHAQLRLQIAAYAKSQGWKIQSMIREEQGILPIALDVDVDGFWKNREEVALVGLRGLLFHPTTGYSLPDAARIAEMVASADELTTEHLAKRVQQFSRQLWQRRAFLLLLNKMMFLAAKPSERHRIFSRFYTFKRTLIERFFSASLRFTDCARLLVGRPPVSIVAALQALRSNTLRNGRISDEQNDA